MPPSLLATPGPGDPLAAGGQAVVVVVLVLAALIGAAWLLRRAAARRRPGQAVRVETAVPLGERRSLVIVSVEGRRLLLGLTPAQVSLVTELDRPFQAALDESVASGGPA